MKRIHFLFLLFELAKFIKISIEFAAGYGLVLLLLVLLLLMHAVCKSYFFCVKCFEWFTCDMCFVFQVTGFCRSPQETRKSSPTGSVASSVTPSRQLTDAEKLRKVILELVETERTYVKVK